VFTLALSREYSPFHNGTYRARSAFLQLASPGLIHHPLETKAMDRDEPSRTQPRDTRDSDEVRRNDALARYDAHPGVAIWLLAGMAFLFIVATYQFITDRVDPGTRSDSAQTQTPQSTVRRN
jgi:hypothetical protein